MTTLALLGGAVFVTLLFIAWALLAVLPVVIGFDEVSPTIDPDLATVVVQIAVVLLLLFAPMGAAMLVLAVSPAALRQRLLAPWLARGGVGLRAPPAQPAPRAPRVLRAPAGTPPSRPRAGRSRAARSACG